MGNPVYDQMVQGETNKTAWSSKPEFQYENYKDILPNLGTYEHKDGSTKKFRSMYYKHPEFKKRFEELGGKTSGFKSFYDKKWSNVTFHQSEDFKNVYKERVGHKLSKTDLNPEGLTIAEQMSSIQSVNNVSQQATQQVNSLKSTESADNLFWDDMTVDQRQAKLASISAEAERNVSDEQVANFKQNNSEFTTNLSEEKVAAESLKSTYSSGDAGLARQLEARTYGVNDDLSITPGTETKWVDEIGDTYGTSKGTAEMTKLAEEKAEAEALAAASLSDAKAKIAQTSATADGPFDKSLPAGGRDIKHSEAYLEKVMAEDKAAQLARINKQLDPIITQNAIDTKDGSTIYTNTDASGDLLQDEFVGTDITNIQEGDIIKSGTAVAEAKAQRLLEAEKETIGLKDYKNDGTVSGTDRDIFNNAKKQRLLDDEKKTVGIEGHVNDGTVSRADQARFDKAKVQREEERRLQASSGLEGLNKDPFGSGLDDIPDYRYDAGGPGLDSGMGGLSEHLDQLEKERQAQLADYIADEEKRNIGDDEGQDWLKDKNRYVYKNDPFRFSTFAYPRDVTTNMENGHYILFYVNVQDKTKYSYDGVDAAGMVVPVGDWVMTHENRVRDTGVVGSAGTFDTVKESYMHSSWQRGAHKEFDTNIDYQQRMVLNGRKGNVLRSNQAHLMKGRKSYQGMDAVHKTTTRITDSVALYLPPGVSDNLSVGYDNSELGMAGFLAFSGGEVVQKWKDQDFEGVTDTIWSTGKGVIVEAIKRLGLGAAGTLLGSDNLTGAFDKAFGQTLNPYIEVTFNNMGMRTFNYTFHFAPKSKQETQDVKDIIQLFRFHMAPELKGTNHRYLTLPSTFDIHYMYQSTPETAKENPFYNKIATCVLQGCDVNYTPEGVKSFESGAPTQINMTLNFQETKMLTKQKINDGF